MSTHIPKGYPAVMPYLTVESAERLLDFVKTVFDAEELEISRRDDGSVAHAAARVLGCVIEMSDGRPEWPPRPGALHVYLDDTDATYQRALDAGATSIYVPADQEYGERSAGVVDPVGNNWYLATYTGCESRDD
ncbi:MAG: VOC family protein [Acidobacteriota bacterium]